MSSARLVLSILCGALADLIFSPPALVSVTAPAESAALLPMVPEHFFGLARPGNASAAPLLFGAHGPSSWDFSSDGGASWASVPAYVPFYGAGVAMQTNQMVPVYAVGGLHPEAYHDLGSVRGAVTPSGWSRSNITTARAAPNGGLSFAYDALARTTFTGVPAPGLNTTFNPAHPTPKVFGFLPLAGGDFVCVAAVVWAGEVPLPSPDGPNTPVSLLAFVSSDSHNWRFSSVVANFSSTPGLVLGPTESDIAYLPDGKTIALVFRMDGDAGCDSNSYRNYYAAYSTDGGARWTRPAALSGPGCVRPKLLLMPGGPLVLSGGRNCVAKTKDISLWTSATGTPTDSWSEYSVTYQHNRLWRGNATFLFDARVNDTTKWETLSYTSVVRTGPESFAVFYNKFMSVTNFPPWPSANFVMQVRVVAPPPPSAAAPPPRNASVAVWGASAAGVVAAIAARRAGAASVLLLSPSAHVGGLTTSGLGCVDAGNSSGLGGVAREFYENVARALDANATGAAWRLTPGAAERVLRAMLAAEAPALQLVEGAGPLAACEGAGDGAATVTTSARGRFAARVWVDASYDGDLAAACGLPLTFGRESNATYNESLAGVLPEPSAPSAGHCQFNLDPPLDPYEDGPGSPLLPGVPSAAPSAPGAADEKVMAYTFRLCITNASAIRVPFPPPAAYAAKDWELLARFASRANLSTVDDFVWRFALPHGKFDVCNYGPLSTMPVGLQWGWPNGTAAERAALFGAHTQYMLGFLWFLSHDERAPPRVRADMATFGLCGDEWPDTGHWPPELYVRESRRLVGGRVFTQADRARGMGWAHDAVGLGAFWFDSVVVDRAVYPSGLQNEGNYNA